MKSELIFLNSADSRRIEAAEEYGALRYAQAAAKHRQGPAWEEFRGGHLVFLKKGAPVGRAHALGFDGKITPEDVEHVERFYFERESEAQVDVSPYADPSLFESLNARGFQVAEFNQTLARRLKPEEEFAPAPQGVEIRRVRPDEAGAWSRMLAQIFFPPEMVPQYEKFFLPWAAPEHPLSLAAFVDGKMAAGAAGLIVPEHRMAGIFGAGTLPQYRGRGIQQAFMRERLRLGQQNGCDLAVTLTMPGTTSQRNVERAGFRVAYTKVVVKKAHPSIANAGPVQPQYSA
ncbi:MAG TPA: GNAT family N-acetyltransferase [Candidatus Angelobacter sp.]|nr:GNAT family N-acetyltransferase [Candidatus Angelobacter sp.]